MSSPVDLSSAWPSVRCIRPFLSYLSRCSLLSSYGGVLSPDNRHFAIPNALGSFDLYDLPSKSKVDTFRLPRDEIRQPTLGQTKRPGRFLNGGSWFLGAGIGQAHLWHVESNIRARRFRLGKLLNQVGAINVIADTSFR
jgi:hypothetical protein